MSGGATWWAARRAMDAQPETRDRLAAWLGVSCSFAIDPFAAAWDDGGWRVLACLDPAPAFDLPGLLAWHPRDTDALAICPRSGAAELLGDGLPALVGDLGGDVVRVYSDGRAWARTWARDRAAYVERLRRAAVPGLPPHDPPSHAMPGLLICGQPERVACWAPLLNRRLVTFDDTKAAEAARAWLLRAAGVPAIATRNRLKAAA